ncbi:MAG: glycosyltransferase [Rhizomicrobium sp.]
MRRTTGLVSVYQVYFMEQSLRRLGVPATVALPDAFAETIAKVLAKLKLLRKIAALGSRVYLVPVNGLSEYMTFPRCYFSDMVTFSFDCWPDRYEAWVGFFRRHRPKVAFISSRASVIYMRTRLPDLVFAWMPEATDPAAYDSRLPLAARTTDLLELGRRKPSFHDAVAPAMKREGFTHLYERVVGEKIFGASQKSLADGLGAAKLVACFPASATHAFAGGVETITHRYFEAIASRCLPVGHAPADLVEMFGYNPVVEIGESDAAGRILSLLGDIARWQPLVERNYRRLLEVGTWDVRARQMLDVIANPAAARPG